MHSIFNLKYIIPIEITIILHNGCNYDYYFVIKEIAKIFERKFTCLRENAEKYITFSAPIKKEVQRHSKMEQKLQKS